ncbi:MAG: SsrA-binding protein SmpB [Bacteroidota bacterium]
MAASNKKNKKVKTVEFVNKKASFLYKLTDTFEAGIMLGGTEIKAIRSGHVNLTDAYCFFQKGELFVKSLYIKEYDYGTYFNHEPRRDRKLLLKRRELKKLERKIREKGFTIVPLRLYLSERGFAKLEIALAQGKRSFDKRNTIKEKDQRRDMDRIKKIRL